MGCGHGISMENKKYDVVALGELLIDFAPYGKSPAGENLFESNPGGAPANVLVSVARQGGSSALIGKVGDDMFGEKLRGALQDNGVDVTGLCVDANARTTLAFVSLDETGNRSFSFFRNPGADYLLRAEEVETALIAHTRIFHFGSLSLTHEPARGATFFALQQAKDSGALISYDPNLRPALWNTLEEAKTQITSCLGYADILKLSEEEFEFITGETDLERHAPAFAAQHGIACLFITLGPDGAFYCGAGGCGRLPAYDVKVVDTTGSGDAFMGAVLWQLGRGENPLSALTADELAHITRYANASGSLAARMKGGIPSIPTAEEIARCMEEVPPLLRG